MSTPQYQQPPKECGSGGLVITIFIVIICLTIIGWLSYTTLTDSNCDTQINKDTCNKALDKDFKIIPNAEYTALETKQASASTCSAISGYKLLADTDFSKINANQTSEDTCSKLPGFKLLSNTDFNNMGTAMASKGACENLVGYKLLPANEYSDLVAAQQNQVSVSACNTLPGYTMVPTAEYMELKDNKTSVSTCNALPGYKLLTDAEVAAKDAAKADPTTCKALNGYKLLTDAELEAVKASADTCGALSGYTLLRTPEYNKLLTQRRMIIRNTASRNADGSEQCLTYNGNTVSYTKCDTSGNTKNQVFYYDLASKTIRNELNQCLDDNGLNANGAAGFYWQPECSRPGKVNNNQTFDYGLAEGRWENRSKGKCLDSNSGSTLHYWDCNANNNNQKWTVVSVPV